MRRILVTGGTGFIGRNLQADYKASRADADLRDYQQVIHLLKDHKPTTVIHAAAQHSNFLDMGKKHTSFLQTNIKIDLNIIEACRAEGIENLLMISSITSFPAECELPYKEDSFFNGDVSLSHYGYAYSKKVCNHLCTAYQKEFGLNYKTVLLGNVYGPHNHFSNNSTVVSNLIYNCYKAKITQEDFIVYGDGTPTRDFIYVKDLNHIFNTVIESSHTEPVIVSSGEVVTVKELVALIVEALDFTGNVIWGNQPNMGQVHKYSDISRLRSIIGEDYKFTSLKQGIKDTCDWYTSNYINFMI